ncbi:hypothetical protein EVAR_62065_1 [Eumeta japonica]|uniref:Uncharacterized protein n=1 Tax=Eumeta variegata TaxID=151549 RepID=A0A4C1YWH3_EUMVA|nr:hypothetical protein EVAR_62065_1 [Eumeta japonica]
MVLRLLPRRSDENLVFFGLINFRERVDERDSQHFTSGRMFICCPPAPSHSSLMKAGLNRAVPTAKPAPVALWQRAPPASSYGNSRSPPSPAICRAAFLISAPR